jgi:serine/threonine protein kinase
MEMLSKEELGSHGITCHETEEELPYIKGEYVAQGASGRVYRASVGSEDVAVKMIDLYRMPKSGRLRAVRECKIMRALDHQNVLRLLAAYYIDRAESIVLVTVPWAPVTLDDFMQDIDENNKSSICPWYTFGSLQPWPELIRQLMEGLEYLHTLEPPIKHKDLKPDNILLLPLPSFPSVRPIIADFGISKDVIPGTRTTHHLYTYPYRTPEQVDMKGTTTKSDVYQLGCCLILTEGVLHSGRVGFRRVYNMAIEETLDNLGNSCRFAGNLASINGFFDAKISELSSANYPDPVTVFCTKFRELVRQMVALDPNDRPCISSALRKFKSFDEAAGSKSSVERRNLSAYIVECLPDNRQTAHTITTFEGRTALTIPPAHTNLYDSADSFRERVSLTLIARSYWTYHANPRLAAAEEEEICVYLAMCE